MPYQLSQIDHKYPDNVRIMHHPTMNSMLTKLSSPDTHQPEFNRLVATIYNALFIEAINNEWPTTTISEPTRMTEQHPGVNYTGEILEREQKAVIIDVARAGMLPSQIGFDLLCHIVDPQKIRQDHIFASRVTNADNQVTGTDLSGSKIGGDIDNAIVFVPDPMGATGSSLSATLAHYKQHVTGNARKIIAIHLIITPEYIKKLTQTHPDVLIYTARVDRGLSSEQVLAQPPGQAWEQEIGLNDQQYIVPGAGGVGELINNSFV